MINNRVPFVYEYLFDFYTEEQASNMPYFPEPKTDNEKLLNFERDFISTGSKKAWSDLWTFSLEIARRFVKREFHKRKINHPSWGDVHEKSIVAVEYVLKRFRLDFTYRIRESFTSELYFGMIHAFDYEYQTKTGRLYADAEKLCLENQIDFQEALVICKKQIEGDKKKKEGKKDNILQLSFDFGNG